MSEENTAVIGFVDWDDLNFPTKQNKNQKTDSDFYKLANGSNVGRVLTNVAPYEFHKWSPEGDNIDPKKVAQYGYTVRCSKQHGFCPLCKMGNKPKRKYMMAFLVKEVNNETNHKDCGKIKILDASPAIAKDLATLNKNKRFGNPFKYDVDIIKDENADRNSYYKVIGLSHSELTEEEMKLKTEWDSNILAKQLVIPTPAQVEEHMNRILKKVSADGFEVTLSSLTGESAHSVQTASADDDFPEA